MLVGFYYVSEVGERERVCFCSFGVLILDYLTCLFIWVGRDLEGLRYEMNTVFYQFVDCIRSLLAGDSCLLHCGMAWRAKMFREGRSGIWYEPHRKGDRGYLLFLPSSGFNNIGEPSGGGRGEGGGRYVDLVPSFFKRDLQYLPG